MDTTRCQVNWDEMMVVSVMTAEDWREALRHYPLPQFDDNPNRDEDFIKEQLAIQKWDVYEIPNDMLAEYREALTRFRAAYQAIGDVIKK